MRQLVKTSQAIMPAVMGFQDTLSANTGHYHIAYLRDIDGVTSVDNGHCHQIVLQMNQEPLGMMEGMPQEDMLGRWVVMCADDGHSHELIPIEISQTKDNTTDAEKVLRVLTIYDEAKRIEESSRRMAYEAEDMYCHKQWDAEIKKGLESRNRAAITINQLEGKIDNLSGYQRQNRTDFKFFPVEGGDERVADMLTFIVKNITEQCYYHREESKVFEDAAITGRGLFNIYEDFDTDIHGKIIIERFKWDECMFAPHEKEDLSDCNSVIKEKWYSESEIKGLYPEEWEEFNPQERLKDTGKLLISEDWDKRLRSSEFVDLTSKKYKVLECMDKEFKRTFILANTDGFVFDAEGWKKKDINAVKTIPGFSKIPRTSYKIRVYKICNFMLLEDYYHDELDFTIVPVYGKYRKNTFWGKIEAAKDLQLLINKAYSQFVDIINKVANYGWFYDDQTFPDEKEKKNWIENASSPGFNQRLTNVNSPPLKIEGVRFPQELVTAISMFANDMRMIVNVNLEMLGITGQEQSGVAMRQKIVQQLIGNDFLFDNLSFAKKKIGRMLVKKIQKLYTPERLLRLLVDQNVKEPVKIGNGTLNDYSEEEILQLLETADLTKYDVEISESPSSPSAMMGNFLMLLELAGKGIQIPPQAILEFAPIPNKGKVLQLIAEQGQQQQAMEDKKYETEIVKTMLSKGILPGWGGTQTTDT